MGMNPNVKETLNYLLLWPESCAAMLPLPSSCVEAPSPHVMVLDMEPLGVIRSGGWNPHDEMRALLQRDARELACLCFPPGEDLERR